MPIARQNSDVPTSSNSRPSTFPGPGRMYSGLKWAHTTTCHANSPMAMAASFGHAADQSFPSRCAGSSSDSSRASRPDSWRSSTAWSTAMAAHLLAQAVGDLRGQARHLGGVDAAAPRDVDRELGRHPAGPAGQEHDAVTEAGGLADVVGHEQ